MGHKRVMQKIYYRMIAWLIPASWTFLAFLIGGTQRWGHLGHNMGWFFVYLGGLAVGEGLARWIAPDVVKFYRWDEQTWWNYNKEETPRNWPEQLWDFEDY